jgi:hypothetical protein
MKDFDIEKWITDSPNDKEKSFRRAVHVILLAISNSPELRGQMIFHGGLFWRILLSDVAISWLVYQIATHCHELMMTD